MAERVRTVKCPSCGKPVEWRPENRFRPFCSERCRQLDLGAWASESYRVPASSPPDSSDAPQSPDPGADKKR